jgi:hypothetical protein
MASRPFWTDANINDQWGFGIFLNRSHLSTALGKRSCLADTKIFKFRIIYNIYIYIYHMSVWNPYVIEDIKIKRFKTIYRIYIRIFMYTYRWRILNFFRKLIIQNSTFTIWIFKSLTNATYKYIFSTSIYIFDKNKKYANLAVL